MVDFHRLGHTCCSNCLCLLHRHKTRGAPISLLHSKTVPTNIWDLILGYVSDRYLHYYNLKSECQLTGLDIVFKAIWDAAVEYQKNYGKVPVLFIDSVDLLAKYDEEVCRHLISYSKLLANKDFIRIVLVSCEGTIVPLMKPVSSESSCNVRSGRC